MQGTQPTADSKTKLRLFAGPSNEGRHVSDTRSIAVPSGVIPAKWRDRMIAGVLLLLSILLLPQLVEAEEVDVALVLAVDVSYSMDADEQRLQRLGYMAAITSPQVIRAIQMGLTGRIALAYVEWGGSGSQFTLVDWRIISDLSSAEAFADALAAAPQQRVFRTSISGGLAHAAELLRNIPHEPLRRVIDVSGDGPNNQGVPVLEARRQVLDQGITINGLPLMLKRATYGWYDIDNLDEYYRRCVIGGPAAFVIPVREITAFAEAVRMKMLLEIAALPEAVAPPPSPGNEGWPLVAKVNAQDEEFCLIGERIWRQRMLDRDWD